MITKLVCSSFIIWLIYNDEIEDEEDEINIDDFEINGLCFSDLDEEASII